MSIASGKKFSGNLKQKQRAGLRRFRSCNNLRAPVRRRARYPLDTIA
jgi:hypothetical protein